MRGVAAGPVLPARRRLDRRFQIHGLPGRAAMHAAQPAEIWKSVGWKVPVIGLRDQRVLDREVKSQRIAFGGFVRIAPPRAIALVDLANVIGRWILAWQQ